MYLFLEFAAVEEVENLHHHESVEDEGEVPRIEMELVVDVEVVNLPSECAVAARSYESVNYSICVFVV